DLQTGTGAPPGDYAIKLNRVAVGGRAITPEHWYLLLLGCWTGFTALRFELAAFLLIVATFAAVLLKDVVIDRHFAIDRATLSRYARYWYADNWGGGTSTVVADPADPLAWRCRLTAVFPHPYCGSGILIDVGHRGAGRDFSAFETATVDLDYRGPAKYLKLTLKNWGAPYVQAGKDDSTKPNVIEFAVHQGHNRAALNLRDAAIESIFRRAPAPRPAIMRSS
ncbi:MAG: hypothetical protein JF615_17505, partial [Asticcacaulis sp.]|nr:hypothetical protein [Asticcacaulis sp.]